MSSHQLNSAFTAAKYRERPAAGSRGRVARYTPRDVRHPARSDRLHHRPAQHRLVRPGLRHRPGRGLPPAGPAGAARRRGRGRRRQRDHHRRHRGAHRRSAVPRHRPVGSCTPTTRITIILPPYSGLGVYGGIVTGTLAAWWYARRRGVSFARWADIVAPTLFVMQAIGRWGNYFNQELYGPPTTLPWGIPIDCAHRLGGLRLHGPARDDALPPAVPVRVDLGHPRARCS